MLVVVLSWCCAKGGGSETGNNTTYTRHMSHWDPTSLGVYPMVCSWSSTRMKSGAGLRSSLRVLLHGEGRGGELPVGRGDEVDREGTPGHFRRQASPIG